MKKILSALLAVVLAATMAASAYAEELQGSEGWAVSFTTADKMASNFSSSVMDDEVKGIQPGDAITFTVTLRNDNSSETDWYMTNKVLHSLEDRSHAGTKGGAYAYRLTYRGPGGTRTLYDSDTVGGEQIGQGGEGLHEATGALQNYFYLDTLKRGQTGVVTLRVALDGETQGNSYQDTLADLQMNFAVEKIGKVVKTGDETRLWPLYVLMLGSGALLLVLSVRDLRQRKREG